MRSLQGIGVALTVPAALALMVSASQKKTRGGSMGIYTTSRMFGLALGPLIGGALYDRFGFDTSFYMAATFIVVALVLVQLWVKEPSSKTVKKQSGRLQIIDRKLLSAGILGVAFATFIMASDFTMMSALENQFNARLGIDAFLFSIVFSALLFSRIFTQVPLGRLSDQIGRKPLIIGGLLVLVPSTALLGYGSSVTQLVILRLIQGIGSGAVAAPAFAVAGDLAQAGGEGRQMSIITMGFGLGIAVGPLLAGILAVYSFTLPFNIGALFTLISAWVIYRYVPETVVRDKRPQEQHSMADD
jgi:MFS family permease